MHLPRLPRLPRRSAIAAAAAVTVVAATVASAAVVSGAGGVPESWRMSHLVSHEPSGATAAAAAAAVDSTPTPRARCGPGSLPETGAQGRVPAADYASGRAAKGYLCNTVQVGHFGRTGGYKVHRYTDRAGHQCAFYDSTLLFPKDTVTEGADLTGTYAMDMSDPAHPKHTATLSTPAMQSPHESLNLNAKRGLLVADMGYPTTQPGWVDVYDVSQDCRHPQFKSGLPIGVLGHESGFSPDGRTFWVSATAANSVVAIDLTDPSVPSILWTSQVYRVHGMSVSDNGNRLYLADLGNAGVTILDVSQIQRRVANPQVREVSHITWPDVSIPQNTIPVRIHGRHYLVEFDEFSRNVGAYDAADPVGAARIIDIQDERHPRVVSDIRLAVHSPQARAGAQQNDPQAKNGLQGYAAHYCATPTRVDPGILACSMIMSGLRVFDIRDPLHPREVAYFNKPSTAPTASMTGLEPGASYAMSAPAFVPSRREIWFTDGNSGFYVVRVTNGAWTGPSR